MNSKTKLQEFYQKRKQTLPVYDTQRMLNTPAHSPMWVSTVTLHDCRQFVGVPASKKNDAEKNAATVALECQPIDLTGAVHTAFESLKEIATCCLEKDTVCIIDMENIPTAVEITNIRDNVFVLGVVGHCHPLASSEFPFGKYVVRSALRDAVDHIISFFAGYIASYIIDMDLDDHINHPTFVFLSRDHFPEAVVWGLTQQKFKAYHVTTVEELVKFIC